MKVRDVCVGFLVSCSYDESNAVCSSEFGLCGLSSTLSVAASHLLLTPCEQAAWAFSFVCVYVHRLQSQTVTVGERVDFTAHRGK